MTAPGGPAPRPTPRRSLAEIDADLWDVGAARVALPVQPAPAEVAESYSREAGLWREATNLFWDGRSRSMASLAAVEADRAERRAELFRRLAAAAAADVAGPERAL